jgi:hypothetical protein
MTRRDYAGGARKALLTGALTTDTLTIACDDLSGWPTGGPGPFYAVIDRDTASEEKLLCSTRTGNSLTVIQRGADSTTPKSHIAGAEIQHVFTSVDADEANGHVNAPAGVHGLGGSTSVVGTDAAQTLTNKTMSGNDNSFSNIPQGAVTGLPTALTNLGAADAAETAARIADVNAEESARIAADDAHLAAGDPHPQYLTPAEGDAAYVNVAGDTMTGPLTIDTASGSGVGLQVKRDNAAIELWSENSPADERRWQQVVSVAEGRFYIASLLDDGTSPVYLLSLDRDGGGWFPALPDSVRNYSATGSTQVTTPEGEWGNLPGSHNLTATIDLPHRAWCQVEWGCWANVAAPASGTAEYRLGFYLGGATVDSDPLDGTWGDIPRVATTTGDQSQNGTINGSRMVLLEAGSTNVQLKGMRYASAGAAVATYTAYPRIRVTPIRFVA